MDVVSGVTTTAATAVVYLKGLLLEKRWMLFQLLLQQLQLLWAYLKGLLWCREEMDVVSGVATTAATALVYLKGLLWCIEEINVVAGGTTTAATAVVYLKGLLWSRE
jgi:hypothetical protein